MSRHFLLGLFTAMSVAAWCTGGPAWAARSELISETTAARHGLTRPWFTQVELDRARGRLRNLVLRDGTLYAQTDKAVVQAIDAETGKTLWSRQVGSPQYLTMSPGIHRDFVAVINGSRLFVLNRYNGDLLLETELTGSPGAGPALSAKRVYIPLVNGQLVAYRLAPPEADTQESEVNPSDGTSKEKETTEQQRRWNLSLEQNLASPLFCQSFGRAMVQPLVTQETPDVENVVWPTDRGYLNLGQIDRQMENHLALKYRLQTDAAIVGQPAYFPPDPNVSGDSGLIVTTSRDGYVYVFREKDGEPLWRFSTGEPIVESPTAVDGRVYVTMQLGGMYCLAIKTGKELWFAPNLLQFVAASKTRVYATDRIGRLLVLDAQSGVRLDSIATEKMPIKLMNTDNDRIYLADEMGLIQCLHEVELTEPVVHDKERKLAAMTEGMPAVKQAGIKEAKKPEELEEQELPAPQQRPAEIERPNDGDKDPDADQGDPFNQSSDDPFDVGPDKADKDGAEEAPAGFGF